MKSRLTALVLFIFLLNTGYIAGFATPSIFYLGNVVLHVALGLAIAVALIPLLRRFAPLLKAAGGLFLVAALAGAWLIYAGATRDHYWVVILHISFGCAAILLACIAGVKAWSRAQPAAWIPSRKIVAAVIAIALAIP